MDCFIVMTMLLVMVLDVSDGKLGDCEYSETAGMTPCQFLCGFTTAWSTCENNICCCGYNNKWNGFRYYEGEMCSGDTVTTPKPFIPCDPARCQATCGSLQYKCESSCCLCINLLNDGSRGAKILYCGND